MNPASDEQMLARALRRQGWTLVAADWAMGWWARGPQGQWACAADALGLVEALRSVTHG